MRNSLELSIHYLNKVRERRERREGGRERERGDMYYDLIVHVLDTTDTVLAGYFISVQVNNFLHSIKGTLPSPPTHTHTHTHSLYNEPHYTFMILYCQNNQ